jgi:hexosaminidase
VDIKVSLDNVNARYLKVTARNFGVVPPGHPGESNPSWLFVDEIIVE